VVINIDFKANASTPEAGKLRAGWLAEVPNRPFLFLDQDCSRPVKNGKSQLSEESTF
jgi:hypothetical protein